MSRKDENQGTEGLLKEVNQKFRDTYPHASSNPPPNIWDSLSVPVIANRTISNPLDLQGELELALGIASNIASKEREIYDLINAERTLVLQIEEFLEKEAQREKAIRDGLYEQVLNRIQAEIDGTSKQMIALKRSYDSALSKKETLTPEKQNELAGQAGSRGGLSVLPLFVTSGKYQQYPVAGEKKTYETYKYLNKVDKARTLFELNARRLEDESRVDELSATLDALKGRSESLKAQLEWEKINIRLTRAKDDIGVRMAIQRILEFLSGTGPTSYRFRVSQAKNELFEQYEFFVRSAASILNGALYLLSFDVLDDFFYVDQDGYRFAVRDSLRVSDGGFRSLRTALLEISLKLREVLSYSTHQVLQLSVKDLEGFDEFLRTGVVEFDLRYTDHYIKEIFIVRKGVFSEPEEAQIEFQERNQFKDAMLIPRVFQINIPVSSDIFLANERVNRSPKFTNRRMDGILKLMMAPPKDLSDLNIEIHCIQFNHKRSLLQKFNDA